MKKKRGYLYIPKKADSGRGKATKEIAGKSIRNVASPEAGKSPDKVQSEIEEGQGVKLVIGDRTELGYKAIIDDSREGLLYFNEIFQPLRRGQDIPGFIKKVREDGKVDLCLQKPGAEKVDEVSGRIIDALEAQGGFIAADDKSPPEVIYRLFGVSKKTFKKAIGSLYKRRLILIESGGIRLAKKGRA